MIERKRELGKKEREIDTIVRQKHHCLIEKEKQKQMRKTKRGREREGVAD